MAVPASGYGFTDVKAEFSGSNNLSDYVRGGAYVPDIAQNAAVSTTVAGLALSQFANTTSLVVTLTDAIIEAVDIQAGDAIALAILIVAADGFVKEQIVEGASGSGPTAINTSTDWRIPRTGSSTGWQVRFSLVSGSGDTLQGGSGIELDTWYALSEDRSFSLAASTAEGPNPFGAGCWLGVEIREGTGAVLDSCEIMLGAYAEDTT